MLAHQPDKKKAALEPSSELDPSLGLCFREQNYIMSESAMVALHTAAMFPDEGVRADAELGLSMAEAMMNYVNRALNAPEEGSQAFIFNKPLNHRQRFLLEACLSCVVSEDGQPLLSISPAAAFEQLCAIAAPGNLFCSGSILADRALAGCMLQHEETHRLQASADPKIQRLLKSGYTRLMRHCADETEIPMEEFQKLFRNSWREFWAIAFLEDTAGRAAIKQQAPTPGMTMVNAHRLAAAFIASAEKDPVAWGGGLVLRAIMLARDMARDAGGRAHLDLEAIGRLDQEVVSRLAGEE